MEPVKRNTGKIAQSMTSHFNSLRNTIIAIVNLLIFSALPLAALFIGSLGINECLIQRMIPIWLTVVGATGVSICGIFIVWCCYKDDSADRDLPLIIGVDALDFHVFILLCMDDSCE
jgi:hypothetical protein